MKKRISLLGTTLAAIIAVGGTLTSGNAYAADCNLDAAPGTHQDPVCVVAEFAGDPADADDDAVRFQYRFGPGAWKPVPKAGERMPDGSGHCDGGVIVRADSKLSVIGFKADGDLACESTDAVYRILKQPASKKPAKPAAAPAPAVGSAPAAPLPGPVTAVDVVANLLDCPALNSNGSREDGQPIADNAPILCRARMAGTLRVFHLQNSSVYACKDGTCATQAFPGRYRMVANDEDLGSLGAEAARLANSAARTALEEHVAEEHGTWPAIREKMQTVGTVLGTIALVILVL